MPTSASMTKMTNWLKALRLRSNRLLATLPFHAALQSDIALIGIAIQHLLFDLEDQISGLYVRTYVHSLLTDQPCDSDAQSKARRGFELAPSQPTSSEQNTKLASLCMATDAAPARQRSGFSLAVGDAFAASLGILVTGLIVFGPVAEWLGGPGTLFNPSHNLAFAAVGQGKRRTHAVRMVRTARHQILHMYQNLVLPVAKSNLAHLDPASTPKD